ncbi:MAG: PHP domain-containing protein [Firmicutes bacterium]|nr:PHP domain-containing protein [Bacillota bacterium]
MKKVLFKADKNIYKANLHCHTTVSDGEWTPEKTKEMYKAKGYSVIAFSDHNKLVNHSYLNDDMFLAINSCEVDIGQSLPGQPFSKKRVYHFILFSPDPNACETPQLMGMDYDDIDAINQYIKDRADEGFLVCYNHPYWSLQTYDEYSKLKGCFAMEIYNHGCAVFDGNCSYSPQVYDEMLRCGNKIFCLSTDDNHNRHPAEGLNNDSFGGFVMINSPSLGYSDIFNALKQGDFYSSQGPEIYEIFIQDGVLNVKCSDACQVIVYTDDRTCHIEKGEALNEVGFVLNGNEKYIRVMCRDKEGLDANSNAYWL